MYRTLLAAILLTPVFACGCMTNPVSDRSELRIIGLSQEVAMGKSLDAQVRSEYKIVTGTPQAERVERIGRRIAAVSDRKDVEYHFALIESGDLNAFAAPGGFIYVTTETAKVADSDAELAAVMAHEVGHVAALHSVKQMQTALAFDLLSALVFDEDRAKTAEAADIAFNVVVMSGFSRRDELQADELGVKYSAAAGYDPYGLSSFFVKLEERNRETVVDKVFEFMRSHPLIGERRRRAESLAATYGGAPQ
jgi:predicted Zn-dependent protease